MGTMLGYFMGTMLGYFMGTMLGYFMGTMLGYFIGKMLGYFMGTMMKTWLVCQHIRTAYLVFFRELETSVIVHGLEVGRKVP